MQSVGTPDAVFLEENLVDDAWGQALRSRMSRVGTGPAGERDFLRFRNTGRYRWARGRRIASQASRTLLHV